ncbi:MAG TPA: DUF1800 domain-containing protein, partial [Candidatus Dormibacteraeota bacterium]|nr:DUF1800 domain-containing protein [Candidatus Dormibacteraeota bacterium]
MSDMMPQPTVAPAVPAAAPASRAVSRRNLIGGSAGIAGLGALLGVGFLLKEQAAGQVTDERQRAAHLLRRAGFAPARKEVDAAVKSGIQVSTEALLHPEKTSDAALEARLAADNFDLAKTEQLRRWWLVRMSASNRPLTEKMTLFWHGLLTSSYRKAGKNYDLMYVQNQFLRQHALGNLRDLLVGISKDGAMLKWLDGTGSSKAHPNENYARELMELFAMGVGNFSESDVRELARALTGWYVDAAGTVGFRPRAHDAGAKTILGHTGSFGLEQAVDIILADPATPRHIATKMWEFFVYPQPSAADLQPVVDAYHSSHFDIRAMMAAILGSPQFFSNRAYRALVKSPTELVAGVSRQLGLSLDPNAFLAMGTMGQALFDPPNVAGWPGGADWLSTGAWMARMRWLLAVSTQHPATVKAASGGATRPQDAVDHAV